MRTPENLLAWETGAACGPPKPLSFSWDWVDGGGCGGAGSRGDVDACIEYISQNIITHKELMCS